MELKGHVLDATEEQLRELILILDEHPGAAGWLVRWAAGEYIRVADANDLQMVGNATPVRVLEYYRRFYGTGK